MSGLFRSAEFVYARVLLSDESAHATLRQVGRFGRAHIVDLSTKHVATAPTEKQQLYKKRVAQAAYLERKLLNFLPLLDQFGLEAPPLDLIPSELPGGDALEEVRAALEPLENSITRNVLAAREQRMLLNHSEERLAVLRNIAGNPAEVAVSGLAAQSAGPRSNYGSTNEGSSLLGRDGEVEEDDEEAAQQLRDRLVPARELFSGAIHGVIPDDRILALRRMAFRVSRGNAIVKVSSIPDPFPDPAHPGVFERKSVVSLLYVGRVLGNRLRKVLSYFGGTEHDVQGSAHALRGQIKRLEEEVRDLRQVAVVADQQARSQLAQLVFDTATGESPYVNLSHALRVEKGVCEALRRCETERVGSSMLQCEMWIPAGAEAELRQALSVAVAGMGGQAAAVEFFPATPEILHRYGSPPTYFPTTKFTAPYQGIVDTYGVPRYQEVNPGLFTIISFPFLFGVMYGDVGHGTLLTLGAAYFIAREKHYEQLQRRKQMDEILGMIFGGRYLLILMGLFAVYAGLIYNDCFSIPLNLFGSRFSFGGKHSDSVGHPLPDREHYPFGVDPGWYHTTNELAFFNSLKMKLAVTLGVAQMLFGIVLSLLNHLHFRNRLAVLFEFVPRILFMLCTFGYMIFLIVLKFCIDWSRSATPPPNLVQTMIAMFLAPGQVDEDKQLYAGQGGVQAFLLLVALASVPVMLIAQPLIARAEHNRLFPPSAAHDRSPPVSSPKERATTRLPHSSTVTRRAHGSRYEAVAAEDVDVEQDLWDAEEGKEHEHRVTLQAMAEPKPAAPAPAGGDAHGADPSSPHYSFADHAITQGIHTIEFVLGCVSNTASYLRLWALSLAHAELSAVFWDKMIMQYGLSTGSPVMVVIGLAVWCCATFAVLLAMDVLECFLHALRLHWVEFQNKFYAADGYAFKPFEFVETDDTEQH